MSQHYSRPERESYEYALPDLEIFELTAEECAARDADMVHEYMQRREFRLAGMNSRDQNKMLAAMVEENGITGGWFYWYCFPGCIPDSDAIGPYASHQEALKAARDEANG